MSSSYPSEGEYHPVLNRVLYVGNVPMDTTQSELIECFDACLGKNSLAFLQYPFDHQAKCYKGFAFVLLNHNSDVGICMAKKYRSWFYVSGKPSQGGYDAQGRAYLRIRPAHVEECHPKKDDATHLVFAPKEEHVGLRDFKLAIEDFIASMDIDVVKSVGELDGRQKFVHIHTMDAEAAAVIKMFAHQFKENDMTMLVRYARKPKVAAPVSSATSSLADLAKDAPEASYVLEPITENYGRFGLSYAQVVKSDEYSKTLGAAKAAVKPIVVAKDAKARVIAPNAQVAKPAPTSSKGTHAPIKRSSLAGTA